TLHPGTKHRFQITIQPNRPDEVPEDATALFQVFQCLHTRTRVLRPVVKVALKAPETTSVGQRVPVSMEATNTGAGPALDLRLTLTWPPGLAHPKGRQPTFPVARLGPGDQCRLGVELNVERGGRQELQLHAASPTKVLSSAQATIIALAPELHLRVEG